MREPIRTPLTRSDAVTLAANAAANHPSVVSALMAVDVASREQSGAKELRLALIAVTPGHRTPGECWCPISRDIPGHGHETACLLARAALAIVEGR